MTLPVSDYILERAEEEVEAEYQVVRNYLSGDENVLENKDQAELLNELGAAGNLEVRSEIVGIATELYDETIKTNEDKEITVEEWIKATYKLLDGYNDSGCSAKTVAAGAVSLLDDELNSQPHEQSKIAGVAGIEENSLRNHKGSIKDNCAE